MGRAGVFSDLGPSYGSRRGLAAAVGAGFVLGVAAGTTLNHGGGPAPQSSLAATAAPAATPPATAAGHLMQTTTSYPAEVLRVIDGDTFEARVRVWPGLDVSTKVRLRGIDAAELHARCDEERAKAQAARAALEAILAAGGVALSQVGIDKYGGRIDAVASTRTTPDVSAAMRNGGFARSYDGGRRGSWC